MEKGNIKKERERERERERVQPNDVVFTDKLYLYSVWPWLRMAWPSSQYTYNTLFSVRITLEHSYLCVYMSKCIPIQKQWWLMLFFQGG